MANPDPFGKKLGSLTGPLAKELSAPLRARRTAACREGYIKYLRAVHGSMTEASGLIDWSLLGVRGLPKALDDTSAISALESDIIFLSGVPVGAHRGSPSVLPTFGVSLGMLCSLGAGARAGRRTASLLSKSVPGLSAGEKSFASRNLREMAGARASLMAWIDGLELTADEQEEALFAARACAEFARRHLAQQLGLGTGA